MKKITFFYFFAMMLIANSQNKLLSSIEEYNYDSNYNYFYGKNYEYDSNGNLLFETDFEQNNSIWEITGKTFFTYNTNNKLTSETYLKWNNTLEKFENYYRTLLTYDTNNNLIEIVYQESYENDVWENEEKYIYAYNEGHLIDYYYSYFFIDGEWSRYEDKTEVKYNSNDKISEIITYTGTEGNYIFDYKDIYTYNFNSQLVKSESFNWENNEWVNEYNESLEYNWDSNGNLINVVHNYNSSSNISEIYTYDTSKLMSNFMHPFINRSGFDYVLEGFPHYNKLLTYTDGFSRYTYNYDSSITLGTTQFEAKNDLSIYPNPATKTITINNTLDNISEIEIYNVLGKKVLTSITKTIDVSNLKSGIYLVSIMDNDGIKTTKRIIKQ
ncbi:T9SS type A sorting domain-containing protein [Tamlana sp. 62-3]|uniref:T9SS type A sorting domain-containing protein n=1 Tax=Neotamlana sargassicola TaxID=2883125 RepID=A0A9X1I694_9FLAO|nr:T9SS type A sorting domain-containing protein [Tamlana sargassicola]MCB4808620.1 T9SS type A sorting domain-containing protein [Tamlana sargassicola]